MDDLYVKRNDGKYVPVSLEVASSKDLADKLIVVTVGSDDEPATMETLEHVQKRFIQSKVIAEAMKRSKHANLLILPHIVKLELISRREFDTKTVCVRLNTNDEIKDLPEIKEQIQDTIKKEVMILPAPLSLNDYRELKAIKERVRIRKQRHGGGLNTNKKQ